MGVQFFRDPGTAWLILSGEVSVQTVDGNYELCIPHVSALLMTEQRPTSQNAERTRARTSSITLDVVKVDLRPSQLNQEHASCYNLMRGVRASVQQPLR